MKSEIPILRFYLVRRSLSETKLNDISKILVSLPTFIQYDYANILAGRVMQIDT